MKTWFIRILAAACLTCSATVALAQPKISTTDDGDTFGRSGQQAPMRGPARGANGGGDGQAPVVTITGPVAGITIPIDTPISFSGTFTDNWGDTHVAHWSFDTTAALAVVSESSGSYYSSGTVSGTWSFSAPGVYQVSLTVTDQWGHSSTASTVDGLNAVVVVFDQDAGFGNGRGRIVSPAGAFPANPQHSGRGDFDFGAKYHKLETVPRGTTTFNLAGAGFSFASTSYDWVVARPSGCLFSGSGTVNGVSGFSFILSAVDGGDIGTTDKFRILIKNKATGAVVYDNQMGDSEMTMATQAIDSGDINVRLPNGGLGHLAAGRPHVEPASSMASLSMGLSQNWPNPFRAKTEVRFSLPQRSDVKLAVYDVAGREVASLADGAWDAGSHTVSWSGRTVSGSTARGGVYFVRMASRQPSGEAFVSVRKMVLQD